MAEHYVYGPFDDNLDTAGLVGALMPRSGLFTEEAGGTSELQIEQSYDPWGKWRGLVAGNIITAQVPVRTTPEIENGAVVTSVEVYTVRPNSEIPKAQRYLYKKKTGNKKLKLVPGGTKVVVTSKPAEGRWKVKTSKYGTGWMEPNAISFEIIETLPEDTDGMESVLPSWSIRPQLFVIQSVEQNDDGVTATALHVSYQLLKNVTTYKKNGSVSLPDALDGILDNCVVEHDFTAFTDVADTRTGVAWELVNPIEALMDPETGVLGRWGVQLIRDNYELFFLKRAGRDRGLRIEYGKNLAGVRYTVDDSNLVTRVIPVGETKDGAPLFLEGTQWIDSPLIESYAQPHVYVLRCEDCKVGTNGVTEAIARTNMRKQAQELLETGCDLPEITLEVECSLLGDSEDYQQYRELERCFLYDLVTVKHKPLGIEAQLELVRMEWDTVHSRPERMTFGTLRDTTIKVASWQLPSGISGGKLAPGTIGAAQLGESIITTKHLQADSINADAIQANAITAIKIAAGAIETDKLAAGSVTADKIAAGAIDTMNLNAVAAHINALTAETIETDQLAAALAKLISAQIGTAQIGNASVGTLTADMNLFTTGVGETLNLDRLAGQSSMFISSVVRDMVIKGVDAQGNDAYYKIVVQADGTIATEDITVIDPETGLPAADTDYGQKVIETDLLVTNLDGQNISGQRGAFLEIFAKALEAGKITAVEAMIGTATIPELYATAIKSLADDLDLSANDSITLRINSETVNAVSTFARLRADGLHVGAEVNGQLATSEVLIDSGGVSVKTGATSFSRFASSFVQFGHYRIYLTTDKGLAFSVVE